MLKNFLRRSILLMGAVVIGTMFNATSARADVLEKQSEKIVTNYLEAVKDFDIDRAVSELGEIGITKDEQKEDLEEILQNPNEEILSIHKVECVKETNKSAKLKVTVEYRNGSIIETPMQLDKVDGEYKLNRLLCEENVINEGEEIPVISPRTQLLSWDLTGGHSSARKYTSKFSSNTDYVRINYRTQGDVEFTVVKHSVVGDTNISNTVDASYSSSAQQDNLNLKSGKSFSNVQLRIQFVESCNCFGELYAY